MTLEQLTGRHAACAAAMAMLACAQPLPTPAATQVRRQHATASYTVTGASPGGALGAALAACGDGTYLVGAPDAGQVWRATGGMPGQPVLSTGVFPVPADAVGLGYSVACDGTGAFIAGAPGGDGVVVVNARSAPGPLTALLGRGAAVALFAADGGPLRYATGAASRGVGLVQVGADIANPGWTNPNLNLGNGARFGAALAVGRFDGDSLDDVIVGAPGAGTFVVYEGLRDGGFKRSLVDDVPPFLPNGSRLGESLALGSLLGGDPRLQLAVGSPGTTSVYVVGRGLDGGAELLGLLSRPGGAFGSALAIGDWDRDGQGELFVGDPQLQTVSRFVYQNGVFTEGMDSPLRPPPLLSVRFGAAVAVVVGVQRNPPVSLLAVGAPGFSTLQFGVGAVFEFDPPELPRCMGNTDCRPTACGPQSCSPAGFCVQEPGCAQGQECLAATDGGAACVEQLDFSITPPFGAAPLTVSLVALGRLASTPEASLEWTFSDTPNSVAEGPVASHQFAAPGRFTVELQLTHPDLPAPLTARKQVEVGDAAAEDAGSSPDAGDPTPDAGDRSDAGNPNPDAGADGGLGGGQLRAEYTACGCSSGPGALTLLALTFLLRRPADRRRALGSVRHPCRARSRSGRLGAHAGVL